MNKRDYKIKKSPYPGLRLKRRQCLTRSRNDVVPGQELVKHLRDDRKGYL